MVLAVAGLIVVLGSDPRNDGQGGDYGQGDNGQSDNERSGGGQSADGASNAAIRATREVAERITQSPDPEPLLEEDVALADPAAAGSMREYLISTPIGNRNRILGLAVTENGLECLTVKSSSLIGTSGSTWRAHCGDTLVYWVEVDEFSRFSVMPMRYGDGVGPMPPVRIVEPEGSDIQ
jgi:hypothetical protein